MKQGKRAQVRAQLDALYARLPGIDCKGLCYRACGPIDMTDAERQRIRDRGFVIPEFTQERAQRWANEERLDCPALTAAGRCAVYEVRPLICRLWGVAESMPCHKGCEPERMLTDKEAFEFMAEAIALGGHRELDFGAAGVMAQLYDDPVIAPLLSRYTRGDHSVESELMARMREHYKQQPIADLL